MDMRTTLLKPFSRHFLVPFLILVAGGAFLLLLGREVLLSRLQTVLVRHMAEEYGLALSVEKMRGTLFRGLRLEGIQGSRLHPGALIVRLDLASLHVEYSLSDLLQGGEAFLAGMRIRGGGGGVLLDLAGSLSPDAAQEVPLEMPAVLPLLALRDFTLALAHQERVLLTCAGSALSLGEEQEGRGRLLSLHSPMAQLHAWGEAPPSQVGLELLYRPDSLSLQSLTIAGESRAAEGRLVFPGNGRSASFTAGLNALDGEMAASGSLGPELIELALRLDRLDLASLSSLLLPAADSMTGRVTASLAARFVPDAMAEMEAVLEMKGQGSFRGEKFAVALQAEARDGELVVASFAGEYAANTLQLREGGVSVASLLAWPEVAAGEVRAAHFSLEFTDLPALWRAAGRQTGELRPLPARHSLILAGSIRERVLAISSGQFQSRGNRLTLEGATLILPVAGESFLDQALTGRMIFVLDDLQEVASLLNLAATEGSVRGSLVISGTLARPVGRFSVQGRALRHGQWSVAELRLEATADRERIRLLSAEAREEGDRLRLSGVWSLTRGKVESAEGELLLLNLGRYGAIWPALGPRASGRLEVTVRTMESGDQHLRVVLRDAFLAGVALSSGQAELSTDWRRFAVSGLALASAHGSLKLAGSVSLETAEEQLNVRLERLSLVRGSDSLQMEKPATLTVSYGEDKFLTIADSLLLAGKLGSLAASGRLAMEGENDFRLKADRFSGSGWLEEFSGPGYSLQGLDLDLVFRGSFSSPTLSLVATVEALASPRLVEPLTGRVDLLFSEETLRLNTFSWRNSLGQGLTVQGVAPFAPLAEKKFSPGLLALNVQMALPALRGAAVLPADADVSGDLTAVLTLAGSWQQPVAQMQIKADNLRLPEFGGYELPEPVSLQCGLSLDKGRLLFRDCRAHSPSLSARLSGQWFDLPSAGELFEQQPEQLPGRFAMEGSLRVADISWLRRQMPSVRRLGGDVEATFAIGGAAARPDFSGRLLLKKGSLRSNNPDIPALDGLQAEAEYKGDTLLVTSMNGLLGGGPFQARGTVSSLLYGEPQLDFTLQGENFLFFRDANMRIRGNGDLHLQGPLSGLDLSGSLAISEGRYTKNFDFLSLLRGTARPRSDIGMQAFSLSDPPLRDMRLRIEVSSLAPFQIRNNLARGAVRPLLLITGSGEIPVLVGSIYVDPVRISLPSGTLVMESGTVTFPENDPDRPFFDLVGRSRLAGYDINLRFQGRAEEPVITLSSQPPLSDEELLLLVLTGQPPQDQRATAGRRSRAGMNMAVYLGRGLLASWFGNGSAETDESLLERFEIEIGRQITSSGQGTVEAQFRLLEAVFLPGDRLYITSEKDVFDSFNIGVKLVFRFR